jgi:hypothetical protein
MSAHLLTIILLIEVRVNSYKNVTEETLILTPYVMVVISFFYFFEKRRFKYSFITAILVIIITISLTLH